MRAIPKFKNSTPGLNHAHFGGILSCMRWDLPRSIRTPNLKFLASPVPDLPKGFKIQFLAPGHWPCPFGGTLSCLRWDLLRSIRKPNLKFLASPVPDLWKGFKILFLVTGPWQHTFWRYFVMLEMGLAKFDVSSFTRSKNARGGVPMKLTRGSPSFLSDLRPPPNLASI